jgi:hypothetical protein
MSLKLWDLAKENAPVATYHVHEQLRSRVSGGECFWCVEVCDRGRGVDMWSWGRVWGQLCWERVRHVA